MQNALLVSLAVGTSVLSQFLFKRGMADIGPVSMSLDGVVKFLGDILRTPAILIGAVTFGASFLVWLVILSRVKLSFIYPITSLNIVLVLLVSFIFFGERLSLMQYAGIGVILVGVFMLARG